MRGRGCWWIALVVVALSCDEVAPLVALPGVARFSVTLPTPHPPRRVDREATARRARKAVDAFAAWRQRLRSRKAPRAILERDARQLHADVAAIDASALGGDERSRYEIVRHHLGLLVDWYDLRPLLRRFERAPNRPLYGVAGGQAAYRFAIRDHLSLTLEPETIRDEGLEELAGIEDEMRKLARRLGHEGTLAEVFAELQAVAPPGTDLRAPALAAQERARGALGAVFSWSAVTPAPIHPLAARWAPPGYYQPHVPERKRGAGFYLATGATRLPLREMEALSFHETLPGHHYQHEAAAAAGHREGLGSVTAFVEGWATYAERVADELGLYSSQEARLGMLCFQAWRACRVVADTGLHAFGWDKEKVRAFFRAHSCLPKAVIEQEIERSLADPARSLGYTIGARIFRRLRHDAQVTLGKSFEVRDYHRLVLEWGDIPFAVVELRLREWMQARLADPT
jgi:uncharacterized protein (DUF885 family)